MVSCYLVESFDGKDIRPVQYHNPRPVSPGRRRDVGRAGAAVGLTGHPAKKGWAKVTYWGR